MKIELSKQELTLLNKVMGWVQDANGEGHFRPEVDDQIESDEFIELNEKIAEAQADAR